MTVNEANRHQLHQRLGEVLGVEEARLGGELASLEARLGGELVGAEARLAERLRAELSTQLCDQRTQLFAAMGATAALMWIALVLVGLA